MSKKLLKRILGIILIAHFFPLMGIFAANYGVPHMPTLEGYVLGWCLNGIFTVVGGFIFLCVWLIKD
jgi:hypothetical protein